MVAAAAAAKKRRGKGGEGEEEEERVDTHSFAPKAGEATGPFPEAVLLRKVRFLLRRELWIERSCGWFLVSRGESRNWSMNSGD